MKKKDKKITKENINCVYKIVCNEEKDCPCSLAKTKKVQVIFDSMNKK